MQSRDASFDEIIRVKTQLRDLILRHYFDREVFGWVWWLGVTLIVLLPIIWWMLAAKKRLMELCTLGLIVAVSATFLDVAGSEIALWDYSIGIPLPISILIPVDFVILPVVDMLIYQKCPAWGKYMLVCVVAAVLLSFGFEPFAIWVGQYKLIVWRLVYSFPIYIIINVFSKFTVEKLKGRQAASTGKI